MVPYVFDTRSLLELLLTNYHTEYCKVYFENFEGKYFEFCMQNVAPLSGVNVLNPFDCFVPKNTLTAMRVVMRELFMLWWWVVGINFRPPSWMSSYPPPTTGAWKASLIVLLLDLGKRFGILGKTLQMGPFALFGDIPESMECQSPLAQVDRIFHDLVTGRWLSVVSTSEPGDEPAIYIFFIFFHCTIQQPRIAVQYSVIVEGNLMLCHQHHPDYDHFAVNLDPTHQATMEEPYVNIVMGGRGPTTTRTQSPGGLSTWASVLPPHALKHGEDARPTTAWTQSRGGPLSRMRAVTSMECL